MSKCYPVNKTYGDKRDCHHGGGHDQDHNSHADCKPNKIIFKCRETNPVPLMLRIPVLAAPPAPVTVTSGEQIVGTIKVEDLCCFKNACVKIENSSNIITAVNTSVLTTFTLKYTLYRKCEQDREFIAIKSPVPLNLTIAAGALATPQTIILPQLPSFCDCEDSCSGRDCCCVYQLRATASTMISTAVATAGTLTVNIASGVISVIAGEENC